MSHRCQSAEALAELLALPAADQRRAEAEACPRCSALLAALRAFHEGDPSVPAAEADEADRVLAALLAAQGTVSARRDGRRATIARKVPERWTPRHRRLLAAVSALAAVVVVAFLARDAGDPGSVGARLRGGAGPAANGARAAIALATPSAAPGGGLMLGWTPIAGADRYVVELFTAVLDTVAVLGPVSAERVEIPAELVTGPHAPGELLVKVRALANGRQLAASPLRRLESPQFLQDK